MGHLYNVSETGEPPFALFAVVLSAIITLIVLKWRNLEFMWWGLLIAVCTFIICWYIWHVITWIGIGFGANLMGFGQENAYQIWNNAVSATSGPLMQYFFFATIPLSLFLLYKKVVTRII